jgi:hypothetical protein
MTEFYYDEEITYWQCQKCKKQLETTNPNIIKLRCPDKYCKNYMEHSDKPFKE